ncbi:hypothetical protein DFH28DRAFT_1084296 [Melampsora americana]|nr:hypothetical protein DFH28DRAFT_1084296 [Melampsora americana]
MTDFFMKTVQVAHDSYTPEEVETLCNQLKENLGEHIFNPMLRLKGFDGHIDTPVVTLHLFRDLMKGLPSTKFGSPCYNNISARWRSFNTKGLNIPPIIPNTLIQFYQSLVGKEFRTVLQAFSFVLFDYMTPEKRHVWTSLCLLALYIFQTDIHNMDKYLKELDLIIDLFLHLLISVSAQWSIQRFGPACLFATEKFELFNGVLQHASVHSNSLSPGRNIANSFTTREMALHCCVVPGPSLRNLFTMVPDLFPTMHHEVTQGRLPCFIMGRKYETSSPLPLSLPKPNTTKLFESFHHVRLYNGQKLEPNDFVLNVERILNVQHNCHEGNCQATKTHIQRLERKEAQQKLYCITHSVSNSYVLNSASHYSGVAHQKLSQYT